MSASGEEVATLTVFGAAPTRATVIVAPLSLGRRVTRALGAVAGCWGAAVIAVFVPVAHFLLVPALAVAGVIWAILRFREHEQVVRIHGTCPRCGRDDDFIPAIGDRRAARAGRGRAPRPSGVPGEWRWRPRDGRLHERLLKEV
jgi:hypothetical protein